MVVGSVAAIGAGLAAIGAGIGIGQIGTNMIVAAALVEAVSLFAVVVALLGNG